MELVNCLTFGTPNGLSNDEMNIVKNKLLNDFDCLCLNDFTIKEIELGKQDGTITFVYDSEPWEQVVCIAFHNSGTSISINSNDSEATIKVYESLCELEWGWIEV